MKWNVQQFAFGSGHLLDGSIGSIISFDLIKRSFRINDAIGQLPTKSVQPGCSGVCPNSNSRRFSKTPETAGMRHTGCWPAPIDGANTTRQRNCPGSMGLEDEAINNFRSLAAAANTMKSAAPSGRSGLVLSRRQAGDEDRGRWRQRSRNSWQSIAPGRGGRI